MKYINLISLILGNNLNFSRMKTKILLKGTMVAIVLFLGTVLLAGSSGVNCQGTVSDQYGNPIEGIYVRSTSFTIKESVTDAMGRYSLTGLTQNTTVRVIVPTGFSASGSIESQKLTEQNNVINFTLHDNSY